LRFYDAAKILEEKPMETRFENRCRFSKENLLEMIWRIRKPATIYLLACSTVLLACSATLFFYLNDLPRGFAALFLALFFILYGLFLPRFSVNRQLKQHRELYHTEIVSDIAFYDDYYFSTSEQTKAETKTDYSQIKRVLRTKHLYLLRLSAQIVYLVDKNGFTKGNAADFESFIREKAVRAKIRF
jgi:hypothetical protein